MPSQHSAAPDSNRCSADIDCELTGSNIIEEEPETS